MKKTKSAMLMLIIILIGYTGIGIVLYLAMTHKYPNPIPIIDYPSNDLSKENFAYLAKVEDMSQISEEEANIIKKEIETSLTKQMNHLNLTKNTDYQIINLNNIKSGEHLNQYLHTIKVASTPTSRKATGEFIINLSVQENINNRKIAIEIPNSQTTNLNEDTASSIKNSIWFTVEQILNQGQRNQMDVDYQITNLNLIKIGAKLSDYNEQIKIISISSRLVGTFSITFIIV